MNLAQNLLVNTVQRFGNVRGAWPLWRRFLLGIFTMFDRACRQESNGVLSKAAGDSTLCKHYVEGVAELAVSDAMQRRLQAITAIPQQSRSRGKAGGFPFWQISFASAMASALLGVVLGAGGYVDEFSDTDSVYLEASMTYEVSDWLAGDAQ